jgi:hypothetical protein
VVEVARAQRIGSETPKSIRAMRPRATDNSVVDASVGTTWEQPKQVSWRNVPVDYRFENLVS